MINFTVSESSKIEQIARILMKPLESGFLTCSASNQMGQSNENTEVKLTDIQDTFVISGLEQKIAVGDRVELQCAADVYNYLDLVWLNPSNEFIKFSKNINIVKKHSKYSLKQTIVFENISKADAGMYRCEAENKHTRGDENKDILIEVFDPILPEITSINFEPFVQKTSGDPLRLECYATGLPIPTVTWYRNEKVFEVDENNSLHPEIHHVELLMESTKMSRIQFYALTEEDSGRYECKASSRIGIVHQTFELEVEGKLIKTLEFVFSF